MKAFAGECMARMRYDYYAKAAKEEGYVQISNIFLETSENEKQHAKRFFKFLGEKIDKIRVNQEYLSGLSKKTTENLVIAFEGENEENTILYPTFAKIAEEEGFNEIKKAFEEIAKIEKNHAARFKALKESIEGGMVFKRQKNVIWKCLKCGYHHFGSEPPEICPACLHPYNYFEQLCENY